MFSFAQSGQGPALPPAGKCLSVSRSHPSRGLVYHPWHFPGTRAASPRCRPSRYPAPRRTSLLPRRLSPRPAAPPLPARAQQWSLNLVGWRWRRPGQTGCHQRPRSRGSSSSETSEASVWRKKNRRINVWLCTLACVQSLASETINLLSRVRGNARPGFSRLSLRLGFSSGSHKPTFLFHDGMWACVHGYTHKPSKKVRKSVSKELQTTKGILFQTVPGANLSLWKPLWNPNSTASNQTCMVEDILALVIVIPFFTGFCSSAL